MSHRLTKTKSVALGMIVAGAVALSAPAEARDLIVIDGPVKASEVDCRRCVKRKALRGNAVSTDKIRSGAVTNGKLGSNAVTNDKIGDGAVGTDEIQDGAVTADKLDPALLDSLSQSSSSFYITLDGDGSTETIATNGPLTYFARCLVDRLNFFQNPIDGIEIVATSSQSDWFRNGGPDSSSGPFEPDRELIVNALTISRGTMRYESIFESSMVAPDGSYLALEGDAGGMGVNLFGHNCLAVGTFYRVTGAP